MDVIETDYTTNPPTITERDFTPEELAQREADAAEYARVEAERIRIETERVAARESAVAKLVALGLNEAEVSSLIGQ